MESHLPIIVLGPIIGKTTSHTARVLIEVFSYFEVECVLTSQQDGSKRICRKFPNRGFPTAFTFDGLEPKTAYKVSITQLNRNLQSSFRTLRKERDNPGKFHVAFVSCNEITQAEKKTEDKDLWLSLSKKTEDLDYVFHIGDQCYMDMVGGKAEKTPYQKCKDLLKSVDKSKWASRREQILEILREHQRRTWSHPSTAKVLANVPNLTILDDHEVRDDWGWREEDFDEKTKECDDFYGQCARQVYYEYQRQLREDIDWENLDELKREYHAHVLNGVGVVFLDYRGSRSWFREKNVVESQLGEKQTEWGNYLFGEDGAFDERKINSVIFISPLPPVYLSGLLTKAMSPFIDDAKEHWTYQNKKELGNLLDLLREWKTRKEGREVTIVGGDVHVGVFTAIYYKKELLFQQMITSAINGEVIGKLPAWFVKKALKKLSRTVDENYTYEHTTFTKKNNYGLMQLESKNGKHVAKCRLYYR